MKGKPEYIPGIPGFTLQDYINEAIEFLVINEPRDTGGRIQDDGYYLGFSGGKDSVVMYELARMSGVKFAPYYCASGIEPPELMSFIRKYYPEVTWLYPAKTFYQAIRERFPPMPTARWCCNLLRKEVSRHIPLKHRLMGIRAEESPGRRKRPRIDPYGARQILYKPIFHWPEWAVWDFIMERKLPYCGLYDEGFARMGCVVCPFIFATPKVAIYQARWPGIWRCFKHACETWFNTKGSDLSGGATAYKNHGTRKYKTFEDFWARYVYGIK